MCPPESITVVFGGSFNPFTLGHRRVVDWLLGQNYGKIVVLPAASHALKSNLISFRHRLEMVRLGLEGCDPKIQISDLEEQIAVENLPVYTYQVLVGLRSLGIENLRFAIGDDILGELGRWNFVNEIRTEFGFVLVPKLSKFRATDVRRKIRTADTSWRELVSPRVACYIEKNKLYQGEKQ